MRSSLFWDFLLLSFVKERKKHIGVILISVVILFLLDSTLFVSSSIKHSLLGALKAQPDFIVQKVRAGERVDMPLEWADRIMDIHGVSSVTPRVYGRYFFEPKRAPVLIMGVDFLDEQSHKALAKLISKTDLKSFLLSDQMIVGDGVMRYLKSHFYSDEYNFLTPKGEFKKVKIAKVLPQSSELLSSNMIIMPIELAREILGVPEDMASDIALNVPNDDEWSNISDKISALYYDLRIVSKKEVQKGYENLYNYKGGYFLILFLITLATFALILYQRYSTLYSSERRHIGLLRAMGWKISDLLKFKLYETMIVIVIAFAVAFVLSYGFVFGLGAPLIRQIFLGSGELANATPLAPVIDGSVLSTLFLLYAVPFIAAVLIPVWRISVTDPKEAML